MIFLPLKLFVNKII